MLQLTELGAYTERLRADPDEVMALFLDLLIGVTGFFRDPDAFAALARDVIPELYGKAWPDPTIRVWVPGCSTGEEAYSLAILMREQARSSAAPRVQIFATDIDERALGVARTGRYPAPLVEGVSKERLARFFIHDGASYSLTKEARELCVFSAHSLIRDPPFARVHLISCRNLLIYLNSDVQRSVTAIFHYALRPGGYLFLGSSENVAPQPELFRPLSRNQRIFQRIDRPPSRLALPLRALAASGGEATRVQALRAREDPRRVRELVETHVLERFAPAHVLVNREGEVIFYSSRTGKYLEAAAGAPSQQLVSLARRGLQLPLQRLLREAVQGHERVTQEHVPVEFEGRMQMVTVQVQPVNQGEGEPLLLVLLIDEGEPVVSDKQAAAKPEGGVTPTDQLEAELQETRERLQSVVEEYGTAIEELKSANEELVSMNEELQSANEELESTREEQQSVNEELHAVNMDLTARNDDLDRLNSDIRNLFDSTQIATVFLDRSLVIRTFTPAFTAVFNLVATDRGRPLTDIVHHLEPFDLRQDIQKVVDSNEPFERSVSRRDGRAHYIMRVLPYRTSANEVEGVLLTFVDVTPVVQAEQHQRLLVAELNHRVRNMLQIVSALAMRSFGPKASGAEGVRRFMGRLHALAEAYDLLSRQEWRATPLVDMIQRQLAPHLGEAGQLTLEGPPVVAAPKAALALGMVIHELATNAVKYGALSVPEGRVALRWTIETGSEPQHLVLRWTESGGPAVDRDVNPGFGTELMERQVSYDLDGTLAIAYEPGGLQAVIDLPFGAELTEPMPGAQRAA